MRDIYRRTETCEAIECFRIEWNLETVENVTELRTSSTRIFGSHTFKRHGKPAEQPSSGGRRQCDPMEHSGKLYVHWMTLGDPTPLTPSMHR
jgi:hypothetical protein